MSPADLEILISQANAGAYSLTLRFRYPAARQDKRFDGEWMLNEVELRKHELDSAAYGEQLAAQLLADPDARSFLDQALAAAGSQQTPLHLRLPGSAAAFGRRPAAGACGAGIGLRVGRVAIGGCG